ncbi:mitochondrial pyruvate carrier 2-like [Chrysoperla carnea]|uniref:mitochondrial pyruvate carrier 2-like n=1 Tax=Chrysoperla carnea TaxID=189513 RepID=UPI001D082D06|nr:mitochondrial pyruvate carrier 2-like [Chrysoperla carnea]
MASALYKSIITVADKVVPKKFEPLWQHPAGPKTVFFWAPMCKWGLVCAGIGDLQRPAEAISLPQTIALSATGLIWSRYSLVIIPKNYSLFSVNVFVAATQLYQMARAIKYQQSLKDKK